MKAITDEPTPINLTNHAYLNLSGPNTKIYEHDLKIYASEYLDFNASDHTVTGVILKLNKGSRFDFNNGGGDEYVRIGDRIKVGGEWPDYGYDNFYVLDEKEGENRRVAS
jgi:aldose 1-epimerase